MSEALTTELKLRSELRRRRQLERKAARANLNLQKMVDRNRALALQLQVAEARLVVSDSQKIEELSKNLQLIGQIARLHLNLGKPYIDSDGHVYE